MTDDDNWTPEKLRDAGWSEVAEEGFSSFVGPFWHRTDGKEFSCGVIAQDKYRNRSGTMHGGMLATLADRALGFAGRLSDPARRHFTIELNIQFIAPARMGKFVAATGTLLRQTSTLAFTTGRIEVDRQLIASISGIWRYMPGPTPGEGPSPSKTTPLNVGD